MRAMSNINLQIWFDISQFLVSVLNYTGCGMPVVKFHHTHHKQKKPRSPPDLQIIFTQDLADSESMQVFADDVEVII